jgi:hypothetical protein
MSQSRNDLSPKSPRVIPEMEFKALIKTLRALNIFHETVGKPYAFRFVGSPYNPHVEECTSILVMAHNRGTTVSPHNIESVLTKFGINKEEFFEAMDGLDDSDPPEPESAAEYGRPN